MLLDKALEVRFKDLPTEFCSRVILPTFSLADLQEESPGNADAVFQHVEWIKREENADALQKEAQNFCLYLHTSGSTGAVMLIV